MALRIFVAPKAATLQTLAQRLVKTGQAGTLAIDKLKALNPHVDFDRLDAGTVLLVPDGPEFDGDDASSVSADAFGGLAGDATNGLRAAAVRMRAGFAAQEARAREVQAVIKSPLLARLQDADPTLRAEVAEAQARFDAEQKQAKDTLAAVDAAEKGLADELGRLGKLFG